GGCGPGAACCGRRTRRPDAGSAHRSRRGAVHRTGVVCRRQPRDLRSGPGPRRHGCRTDRGVHPKRVGTSDDKPLGARLAEPIDEYFTTTISALSATAAAAPPQMVDEWLAIFDAQLGSRHLDLAARWLRSKGKGYYTIGSSGHEGNAAVAAALRPTDPALLHYRSGGFFLARAAQVGGRDP